MLTDLFVRNFTLIESLQLSLGQGLTVFTGETGAGKSILLEALHLLTGGRADISLIRDQEKELEVSAQFALDEQTLQKTNERLKDLGLLALDEPDLILRRILSTSGRHKQFLNGSPITVAQMRELASPLIDFTGQHAGYALLQSKGQMAFLDAFAANEKLLSKMKAAYEKWSDICQRKEALISGEKERLARLDWLSFQIAQIEKVDPQLGEFEKLKSERDCLANVEKIRDDVARAFVLVSENQEGEDVLARLKAAQSCVLRARKYDEELETVAASMSDAISILDDVSRDLGRYAENMEADPQRLADIEDRLDELRQLTRKHGDSISSVLERLDEMKEEALSLEHSDQTLNRLEAEAAASFQVMVSIADELTRSRKKAAQSFGAQVKKEIADLGLSLAIFDVQVEAHSSSSEKKYGPYGADMVTILFGANPGEPANPLERVASGGELSRVLLGIKRVLLTKDLTLVSIFDEVDAGVGGAMGEAIGEKLQTIAEGRQVLCVTHLAQVAARATCHMLVEKEVRGKRTISMVRPLKDQERVEELARMLGGRELTDITRKHAREFLERAQGVSP